MGVPSINDLAVDGMLNTTNQPTMDLTDTIVTLYCQQIRDIQTYECSCPDQTMLRIY